MKNLCRSLFTFAVILCVVTIMTGCSVGIRPAYYDLPPSDNNNYNYGESSSNQYNSASTSSDYRYDYSSTYDPWTMGNYYENYSPPQRSGDVQASTDNSPWVGDKRPVMKDRGTVTGSESKAPRDDSANLRRERAVQRENASKGAAESSTSSIVNQKTRRNVRRDTPQANQEQSSSQTNIKKENSETSKSDDSKKDEEDKDKKKRKTGTN